MFLYLPGAFLYQIFLLQSRHLKNIYLSFFLVYYVRIDLKKRIVRELSLGKLP